MGWQDAPVVDAPAAEQPAWAKAPTVEEQQPAPRTLSSPIVADHFKPHARAAESFMDYLAAGWQQSSGGLAKRGKVPDVALDEEAPWYGRAAAGVAGLAGDAPAMLAGGFVATVLTGGRGGPVVAGAGAFALPMMLRAGLMDAYTKGEVQSSADFVDRSMHVAWEGFKGGVTGAATVLSGGVAKALLPAAAPLAARILAPTAAEVATMTTVGHALEGKLPEPQDFLDAAILIGGLKGSIAVAPKLRAIYAQTGKRPEQVLADAERDPQLKEELLRSYKAEALGMNEFSPAELAASQARAKASERTNELRLQGLPEPMQAAVAAFAAEGTIPREYAEQAARETGRAIVPGDKAIEVANRPFADIPQAKGEPAKPTHVNYNFMNSTADAKAALARLSEVYEEEIQTQRRGAVGWQETSNEAAKILSDTLGGVDTRLLMPREPGTAAGAAEILARKQMTIGAAEAMMGARDDLLAKGEKASHADKLAFLAAVERTSMIQSEFLGARAEAGRALNILKSTVVEADRAKQIQDVIQMYGADPLKLAEMMRVVDDPAGALKFAKAITKPTTWEKIIEAWKASILSGPVTHMANLLGNGVFAVMRAPIDAVAAGFGLLHGGERVAPMEPIARLAGLLQGSVDGARLFATVMRTGEQPGKSEQFRKAISGLKGEIIRLPFRFLSAEDAIFSTMNKRGEAYSLAVREATKEGLNPLSREFRERVQAMVENPTDKMAAQIEAAGDRFTFNTPLGEKGQALQTFVRKAHLEWAVPFIRTPGNILKEMARMTPLAPLVKEWRSDIKAGGAARDKALAELAVGTGVSTAVFMYALEGNISGAGDPDPGKRRAQAAAGWQPYSVKVGDTWYSYQRIQPIGTLMGMAADVAEVWDHLTPEESDKVPKMIAVAFANAVTNQTALQGITSIVQVLADPQRYGPKFIQQYAASLVPNIVGQPTAMLDPVVREVNGMVDAIKARIPGMRGELLAKRDVFGEPIETKERLGAVSPVAESKASEDKVRTEMARLGLSAAEAPKKVHIGKGSGKLGDVKLEPEQRDRFAETSGKLAHEVLTEMVNDPGWDALPDLVKKRAYAKVFMQAHKAGAAASLPEELRAGVVQEITEKVTAALQPSED